VGEITTTLDGEAEARGRVLAPVLDGRGRGEAVKTIIDLDGIKVPYVPAEVLGGIERFRVETAAPMLVVPSGGSDPELLGCGVSAHAIRIVVPRLNL
jgi:hypothetical protein